MAGRVHTSFHSGLCFSSLLLSTRYPKSTLPPNRRLCFPQKPFPSSSIGPLFSTCSNTLPTTTAIDASEPFVITTPLYYVNAPPHMGSAYTTIAADAIARFQRLLGKKVIFITGTDEHGEKIATAAAVQGSSPSEHCDVISHAYTTLWKDLDIAYDKFIRTTDPKHEAIVKEFYVRVLANGDIYRADYEGLYCVNCEEYKDEKELLDNNCCPMHLKPCVPRKEDNYFFALSKYQKVLEEVLIKNPDFVQPSFRLNEVQSWIRSGLRDFSISRASVEWGIRLPNDNTQTIYVWFDALVGYLSALSKDTELPNLHSAASSGWPASLHLIGKDILRFHAVYWPAILLSAGLDLPKMVFGHGFLTKDGMKMGKSLGNTLEPNDLVHRFGSDAVRYFFLREVEFGSDGDYSEDRFVYIVNAHLANTIGNLLNRTLWLLKKNCQSTLMVDSTIAAEGKEFKDTVKKLVEKAHIQYQNLSLASACDAVLEIGNAGNLYMDSHAPWSLFKKGGAAAEQAAKDLVVILEAVRIIAVALSPVTPSLCLRIYAQLGYSKDDFNTVTWSETEWGGLKGGQVMAQPKPVFTRIENTTDGEVGVEAAKVAKGKSQQLQQYVRDMRRGL
ncbi:methionine--tRNA ligase, chloroplastic/mitochondrial [Malania oleifera]|uniref:methionine--tRNA ligase, chloroplastic/mitochondrial n=1 Tax=Malania oleifera TaxID=397392 RepID=UPI0025AE95D6|nr:methionine--tRNA ligase, chloroplastic/mitochondrial [Malania oleifera]